MQGGGPLGRTDQRKGKRAMLEGGPPQSLWRKNKEKGPRVGKQTKKKSKNQTQAKKKKILEGRT